MKTKFALFPLLLALCLGSLRADVVTLSAAQDTSLFQNNVTNSDGGGPAFFTGTNGTNSIRRALISFNFSSIPANAIITNVQLTLTLGQVSATPPPNATISLYDVGQSWNQGTAGSTATTIGGTGQGFTASAGDATWSYASDPTNWSNGTTTVMGGYYSNTFSATLFLNNSTVNNSFTWLSTPQLVADVQGWLANPSTNYGWELINANETTANSIYGFYSSEWDNAHFAGSASQAPALQVTYTTVPEAGTGGLCAGAMLLALLSLRPRRGWARMTL